MKKTLLFLFLSSLFQQVFTQNIITDATWRASTPVPVSVADVSPLTNFNALGINHNAVVYIHPKFSDAIWANSLQKENLIGMKCYLSKTFMSNNRCPVQLQLIADNHCRLYVNNKLYIKGNGYSTDYGMNNVTLNNLSSSTTSNGWNTEYYTIDNLIIGQNTILVEAFDSGYPSNNHAGITAKLTIDNTPLNVFAGNNVSICQGKNVTLNAIGGVTYLWNTGEKTASIQVKPDTITTYTVVATDVTGCKVGTAKVTVKTSSASAKNITIPKQVCSNQLTLNAPEGLTYLWNTGEINKNIKAKAGNYQLTITDSEGCKQTTQITVPAPIKPSVSIINDLTIFPNEKIQLDAQSNIVPNDIIWSHSENLTCNNCLNPFIKTYKSEIYKITIYDIYGREASDVVHIKVLRNVFAPNVFSPNGDQNNDNFSIQFGKGIKQIKQLQIFDRWGELIHQTDTNTWDGTFKGKETSQGTYVFLYSTA